MLSINQISEQTWAAELAADLEGTDWQIEWSGVTRLYRNCVARVYRRAENCRRHIQLPETFRTSASRKAELFRQLSI